MNKALSQLIKVSNTVGKDASLVQGGGGNTSVKTADGKYMYLKASGTALKDMNEKKGWRKLQLDAVLAIIKDPSIAKLATHKREDQIVNKLLLACTDKGKADARPSVEAHLHAFLGNCVIHLHPSTVGAYVNTKRGKTLLQRLFADISPPPLWVPYTDPGFTLAGKIAGLIGVYQRKFNKKPSVLFLEKHGLIVSGKDSAAALRLLGKVISRCKSKLKYPKTKKLKPLSQTNINDAKLCIRKAFLEATGKYVPVSYFYDKTIADFLAQRSASKMLAAGILTPDELVYANGPAMWVGSCNADKITARLVSQVKSGRKPSAAFLVKGLGLFIAAKENFVPTVRDVALSSFFIRTNASRLGGINVLNSRQQNFISEWEAEAFRKKIAKGVSKGDLQDRIAVVTGAGSGLGKSIAIGLARAGAIVALADIDTASAEKTAEDIKKEQPQAQLLVLKCDVTSEGSVNTAFKGLLDNWGGLDILVNTAGIAPAYPLVELPVDKWRMTLEVNLTGYFLCAKAAAGIMIKQGIGGSIINVSSKSGLEASKSNTPYNATKAGEIHMARGWALELGEHGIRVNAVAPGNIFEGSKIWNPAYIKQCAKKYGIKPEEVIPYYVGKTALAREIKGQDVADAVVFLCSDKARTITGQTLVVDSGQAMVR